MKVVVINGYPGAGKDTFVELCSEYYSDITNIVTSTPQKRALHVLGWNGDKTKPIRNMLAQMKQDSNKLFNTTETFVTGIIDERIYSKNCNRKEECLFFIHSREPEEIQMFKDKYEATTLFIDREEHEIVGNSSDLNVEDYIYDVIISNNNTIEELSKKAKNFIYGLNLEVHNV